MWSCLAEDTETEEKYVTVLVDGAESNLTFLDTVREGDEKDQSVSSMIIDLFLFKK